MYTQKATRLAKAFENMKQSGLFRLEKRVLRGNSIALFSCLIRQFLCLKEVMINFSQFILQRHCPSS